MSLRYEGDLLNQTTTRHIRSLYSRNQKQRVYNRDSISLAFSLSKYRAEDDDLEPSEVILAKFPVFDPDGVKFGFSAWEQQNIAKKTFLRRTVPEKYLDLFAQFFLRVFLFFKKSSPNKPTSVSD